MADTSAPLLQLTPPVVHGTHGTPSPEGRTGSGDSRPPGSAGLGEGASVASLTAAGGDSGIVRVDHGPPLGDQSLLSTPHTSHGQQPPSGNTSLSHVAATGPNGPFFVAQGGSTTSNNGNGPNVIFLQPGQQPPGGASISSLNAQPPTPSQSPAFVWMGGSQGGQAQFVQLAQSQGGQGNQGQGYFVQHTPYNQQPQHQQQQQHGQPQQQQQQGQQQYQQHQYMQPVQLAVHQHQPQHMRQQQQQPQYGQYQQQQQQGAGQQQHQQQFMMPQGGGYQPMMMQQGGGGGSVPLRGPPPSYQAGGMPQLPNPVQFQPAPPPPPQAPMHTQALSAECKWIELPDTMRRAAPRAGNANTGGAKVFVGQARHETTPAHIAAIFEMLGGASPTVIRPAGKGCFVTFFCDIPTARNVSRLNRRLLLDHGGAWYAESDSAVVTMHNYVNGSAFRNVGQMKLPKQPMVIEYQPVQ
uniref:Uncharacterized protein n=1 Tax=Neobodo designis TaxID=312471 RepID=A0A7S1PPD1_NEODS|mmetsp:Transcript_15902/g.49307  ORF Transcript_15902/g.49307 Transcript_15902/m.49307 type:complete len:466 (+) Transcript_15902:414-1811(+)